jgi:hypothetical protein
MYPLRVSPTSKKKKKRDTLGYKKSMSVFGSQNSDQPGAVKPGVERKTCTEEENENQQNKTQQNKTQKNMDVEVEQMTTSEADTATTTTTTLEQQVLSDTHRGGGEQLGASAENHPTREPTQHGSKNLYTPKLPTVVSEGARLPATTATRRTPCLGRAPGQM